MPTNAILATAGAGDDLLVGYRWLDDGEVHLQHRPTRGEQPQDDIRRAFCTRIPLTAWDQVCTRLTDAEYWANPLIDRSVYLTAGYDHWTFKRKPFSTAGAVDYDQVWVHTAPLGPERGHIIVLRWADWTALVAALVPSLSLRLEDLDAARTSVLAAREFRPHRGRS